MGFWNLREYTLHRDNHKCQNPNCKNKDKEQILEIHHIKYKSLGGVDNRNNLIGVNQIRNAEIYEVKQSRRNNSRYIVEEKDLNIIEMEVDKNHIHILVQYIPTKSRIRRYSATTLEG